MIRYQFYLIWLTLYYLQLIRLYPVFSVDTFKIIIDQVGRDSHTETDVSTFIFFSFQIKF